MTMEPLKNTWWGEGTCYSERSEGAPRTRFPSQFEIDLNDCVDPHITVALDFAIGVLSKKNCVKN